VVVTNLYPVASASSREMCCCIALARKEYKSIMVAVSHRKKNLEKIATTFHRKDQYVK